MKSRVYTGIINLKSVDFTDKTYKSYTHKIRYQCWLHKLQLLSSNALYLNSVVRFIRYVNYTHLE